jgi:hypothetical protein
MRAKSLTTCLSILAIAYGGATACRRSDRKTVPAAQVQTQSPAQAINQPMTVTGCLRAGEGSDTFVLTTSQRKDGASAATYVLVANEGVNLRDNVGHRVEVNGVLSAQQETSTVTSPAPPQNKPTGTGGTPAIQTQTELDMRRFEVRSVSPLGDRCDR